ncbi:MAG TPA: sulfurtransferase TusA family protein [Humibacillus xanthopallidus]|nr:sulfurtransferase TusA family protein [Humibacillus xanthopallidus]
MTEPGTDPTPERSDGPLVVDARGERCPLPVIRLARLVRDLPPGEAPVTVRVLATDPAAASDVPAWCRMRGQRFVGAQAQADHTAYVVEVRPTPAAAGR